jgi:glucose/mannose-6-phosphate isomerase
MAEPVNLDDVMALEERDPGGMLAAIENFSKQCSEALRLGRDQMDIPSAEDLKRIAFVGMGGSAIGGDILRVLLEEAMGIPVGVHRSYRLPSMLRPDTLAIFASYSGNTEETLSAFDDAIYLGCRMLVITTGGALLDKAQGYRFPTIVIPEGMQPRAALGYLSLPAAVVLEKMGVVQGFVKVSHEAVDFLKDKKRGMGPPGSRGQELRQAAGLAPAGKGPGRLWNGRPAFGGGIPLEMPVQREREDTRLQPYPAGDEPQRDRGMARSR